MQTKLLSQIIANRIALIMVSRRKSLQLRWALFLAIGIVNIAVATIWIPAHMGSASNSQRKLNFIFENVEKSFFLVLDLSFNLYFLYLIRYRLIADGLGKYQILDPVQLHRLRGRFHSHGRFTSWASQPAQPVRLRPIRARNINGKTLPGAQNGAAHLKVVRRSMNRVDDSSTSQHQSSSRPGNSHSYPLHNLSKRPVPRESYDNYGRMAHDLSTYVSAGVGGSGSDTQGKGDEQAQGILTVVEMESREGASQESSGCTESRWSSKSI
ncbi:hypothetical protein BDW62DRAFT_204615 [Aspergillus aurantiobrunneus]